MSSLVLDITARRPDQRQFSACMAALQRWQSVANEFFTEAPKQILYDGAPLVGTVWMRRQLIAAADALPEITATENPEWMRVDGVALEGMVVSLPDVDNTGAQEVSFVFMRHAHPALDGLLVRARAGSGRTAQADDQAPPIRPANGADEADWRLDVACVYTRYYLSKWFPQFLAWVRCYHLPTLASDAEQDFFTQALFPGIAVLSQAAPTIGDAEAELQQLLENFCKETAQWRAAAADA